MYSILRSVIKLVSHKTLATFWFRYSVQFQYIAITGGHAVHLCWVPFAGDQLKLYRYIHTKKKRGPTLEWAEGGAQLLAYSVIVGLWVQLEASQMTHCEHQYDHPSQGNR